MLDSKEVDSGIGQLPLKQIIAMNSRKMPKCPMPIANDPFPKQPLWNKVYKAGTKGIQHFSVIF